MHAACASYKHVFVSMCSICLVCAVFVLSCRAKSVDLHVVPDGNSTLVLANRLITTFTPKSHMHLTRIYTNRCTEVGIQKPNSSNVTLVFNQESAQLLPGVC